MLIAIMIICSVLTIVIASMRATKLHNAYKEERRMKEENKKNGEQANSEAGGESPNNQTENKNE